MKLTLNSSLLLTRLQTVSECQQSKNLIPVLSCIHFLVKDGTLRITASDSETQISTVMDMIECDVEDGQMAIEASLLINTIKEIPDQPITLDYKSDTFELHIEYLNGEFNCMGSEPQDFPIIMRPDIEHTDVVIDQQILRNGIQATFNDSEKDSSVRPHMCGISIDKSDANLNIIGSDGMMKVTRFSQIGYDTPFPQFTIPNRPASILKKIINRGAQNLITVVVTNSSLTFENINGTYTMECRRLEGNYPSCSRFFNYNTPCKAIVDRRSLIAAIRRVQPAASTVSSMISLAFDYNTLTVAARDLDYSLSSKNEMNIDYTGHPVTLGIHAATLVEKLSIIESESVVINLTSESAPIIIRPTEQQGNVCIEGVIMVMALNNF